MSDEMPPGSGLLRAVSRVVPPARRAEWLDEWRSELVHARDEAHERGEDRRRTAHRLRLRAASSVRDALWIRRDVGDRRPPRGRWEMREATRVLFRQPGLSLAVIATLGLGIGATTAIFTVVDALMLRPLPFVDPDRLVLVQGGNSIYMAPEVAEVWRSTEVFESISAFSMRAPTITRPGEPRNVRAEVAEPGFLRMLGLEPVLGREFLPEEAVPGRDRVVLLSDEIWRGHFGEDPRVVGREIFLDDEPYTVVGVMPPTMRVMPTGIPQIALPLTRETATSAGRVLLIGRLRPDLTRAAADERLAAIGAALQEEQPREGGWQASLHPLGRRLSDAQRRGMLALSGAVVLLLLVACVNGAGLLFVRGLQRQPEMAIRRALGASPARLFREGLIESLLLALLAGAAGMLLAWWGVRVLVAIAPEVLTRWSYNPVTIDGRVLAFTLGLTVLTGLGFGLLPALRSARTEPLRTNRGTLGRSQLRARAVVQAAQLALAVMLLSGAGLLGRSFLRLTSVDPGFEPEGLLTLSYTLPRFRYPDDESRAAFNRELDARLRGTPGVDGLAWTFSGITGRGSFMVGRTPQAEGAEPLDADGTALLPFGSVDTAYFRVMGIHLREGRGFGPQDLQPGANVVIIDTDFARRLWPEGSAAGRRFRLTPDEEWLTVVGVMEEVKLHGPDDPLGTDLLFHPTSPDRLSGAHVVIRAAGALPPVAAAVRAAVQSLDPGLPVSIQTGRELAAETVAQSRFVLTLMAVFAAVALLLAAIGVYGLVAFTVARRTREIGIRKAIGARGEQILARVIGQGLGIAAVGLAAGIAGALALSRFIASLLFETSVMDLPTLALVAIVLTLTCTAALLVPAARAARVDAAEALRTE